MSNEELAAAAARDPARALPLWEQVQNFAAKAANKWLVSFPSRPDIEFDDLMSEAYIALLQALEGYNAERASFLTWYAFFLKSRYTALYGFRTARTTNDPLNSALSLDAPLGDDTEDITLADTLPDTGSAQSIDSIEHDLYTQQLHAALIRALDALPERGRRIIRQRYFEGKSARELAEETGTNISGIYATEKRCLQQIRNSSSKRQLQEFITDFNYYQGTGLSSFTTSGASVQERFLMRQEQITKQD